MKCKPGDIAIVVKDESGCTANIGRFVRIHGPEAYSREYKLRTWLIQPLTLAPWACCRKDGSVFLVHPASDGSFDDDMEHPDAWLMPIRRLGENINARGVVSQPSNVAGALNSNRSA